MKASSSTHLSSLCVKDRYDPDHARSHALPIIATSSFNYADAQESIDVFQDTSANHVYSRYGNPTIDAVASKLAAMESVHLPEQAAAILCSTGMSAISTLLTALLRPGQKVLTQGNIYGGTTELLRTVFGQWSIETVMVNFSDLQAVEDQLKLDQQIGLIYLETPSNPSLDCIDLQAVTDLAKIYSCPTAIDNTFATPYLQRPLEHGVDYVVHSATKYLNGHGNSLSGALLCRSEQEMKERFWPVLKLMGTSSNAFDAWLLNTGMRTLALRMDRHCSNAQALAEYLSDHPAVSRVNYPGLRGHSGHSIATRQMDQYGGMLSLELKGGLQAGIKLMDGLDFCTIAPTLGDVDTLVLHPASSSHLRVPAEVRVANGITDGLVRCSVGIEHIDDIIADYDQALSQLEQT